MGSDPLMANVVCIKQVNRIVGSVASMKQVNHLVNGLAFPFKNYL